MGDAPEFLAQDALIRTDSRVVVPGFWRTRPDQQPIPADRTDAQGGFVVDSTIFTQFAHQIHVASADFSRPAVHVVQYDDPDKPLEITLLPVRLVRARVFDEAGGNREGTEYSIYALDAASGSLDQIPAIADRAAMWSSGLLEEIDKPDSDGGARRLEVGLPVGRYKVNFRSETVHRVMELVVPPGSGPVNLPDVHLEPRAWAKLLNKQATEIEAADLDGRPVKLADNRGKVVVVAFWTSKDEDRYGILSGLQQVQAQLKGQPLSILAIHDASLKSVSELKETLGRLSGGSRGEITIRVLVDRAPLGESRTSAPRPRAGERGSGQTADIYEVSNDPTTLVVDKNGRLVSVIVNRSFRTWQSTMGDSGRIVQTPETWFETSTIAIKNATEVECRSAYDGPFSGKSAHVNSIDGLVAALESALGLPRSQPVNAEEIVGTPAMPVFPNGEPAVEKPALPAFLNGKVIDLDGHPIAGATVTSSLDEKREHAVKAGPTGEFAYKTQGDEWDAPIEVAAPGFVTEYLSLLPAATGKPKTARGEDVLVEPSGAIREPLRLGPGVTIAGRVVRDGKPVPGVVLGLNALGALEYIDTGGYASATTDQDGSFRFLHVAPQAHYWVFGHGETLKDFTALTPVHVLTKEHGSTSEIGDLHVQKGRTLAGQMICSDRKGVPGGIVLQAWNIYSGEKIVQEVNAAGRFELHGLPDGHLVVSVQLPESPGSTRYRLSAQNKCLNPHTDFQLQGRLGRDVTDLTILLEPVHEPNLRAQLAGISIDPAVLADYKDAKAGPITGVAPRP